MDRWERAELWELVGNSEDAPGRTLSSAGPRQSEPVQSCHEGVEIFASVRSVTATRS